jgi:hypothetical protein
VRKQTLASQHFVSSLYASGYIYLWSSHVLRHALKEWAVICRLLAEGRQTILLRKGGIAEAGGAFRLEHDVFWLYPTYVHQQGDGIRQDLQPQLQEVQKEQLPPGIVRFTHFATASRAYLAERLDTVLGLQDLHGWSQATVCSRFAYRRPGLFVVPVRVYRVPQTCKMPESVEYAGRKSWVELATPLPTETATPIMDGEAFSTVLERLNKVFPAG